MGSIFQEAAMGLDDYVELPDLSLSALQKRFTLPSELEELYQRYEQRFQVGKWVCWYRAFLHLLYCFTFSSQIELWPQIFSYHRSNSSEIMSVVLWK